MKVRASQLPAEQIRLERGERWSLIWQPKHVFGFRYLLVEGENLYEVSVVSLTIGCREQLESPWELIRLPHYLHRCPSVVLPYENLTAVFASIRQDPVVLTVTPLGVAAVPIPEANDGSDSD